MGCWPGESHIRVHRALSIPIARWWAAREVPCARQSPRSAQLKSLDCSSPAALVQGPTFKALMTSSLGPRLFKFLLKGLSVLTFSYYQMLAFSYQCGGGIANKGKGEKLVWSWLSDAALCTAACVMSVASSWASVLEESHFFFFFLFFYTLDWPSVFQVLVFFRWRCSFVRV